MMLDGAFAHPLMQYEAVSEKGFSHPTEDKGKETDLSESDGEHR